MGDAVTADFADDADSSRHHAGTIVFCLACGYDLRACSQSNCPECGKAFDSNDLTTTTRYWRPLFHRARFGFVIAWLVGVPVSLFGNLIGYWLGYIGLESLRSPLSTFSDHLWSSAGITVAIAFTACAWDRSKPAQIWICLAASALTTAVAATFLWLKIIVSFGSV